MIVIIFYPGRNIGSGRIVLFGRCLDFHLCTDIDFRSHRSGGSSRFTRSGSFGLELCCYLCAEGVHRLTVLREPVHNITVVRSHTLLVAFTVADNVLFSETVLLTKINAEVDSLLVYLLEVGCISKTILADFKSDVGVVSRATGVPTAMIPGQTLIRCYCTIRKLTNEAMYTDFTTTGMIGVPVVVILVLSKSAIIGADIAF